MSSIKPGLCWVETKNGFRPFVEFRHIIRGRNKGKVEVVLPARPSRKVLLEPGSIKRYPVQVKGDL